MIGEIKNGPKRPTEVNPWREHVIENEPTHEDPRELPAGDVPMENEMPLQDTVGRVEISI